MNYLACDLGAESGRLMLGSIESDTIRLAEVHRFANTPFRECGSLQWDIETLFDELKAGLKKAASPGIPISSISTDSWGVDYVLLDAQGTTLRPAFHYRDSRTKASAERALARVSWPEIFAETGIQFMAINTLFQLAAESSERLAKAARILGIADAFNYWLCGQPKAEESLASTFQLYNPRTRNWSSFLQDRLGLRPDLFPPIVPSATILGPLQPSICAETGLNSASVIATCSHDTGAAVAAVPAVGENWAYLSSGTWSLMGLEIGAPILTDQCRALNFTNEIGHEGTVRLLKNIVGLWIVQECRREWHAQGKPFTYAELACLAEKSEPFACLINPADPRFLEPGNMPEKVEQYCGETGQTPPRDPGAIIRCVLESLALLYRKTFRELEQLVGKKIERLHIVGGGSQNRLLNQFTADALEIPIHTGPVEATALGNVLIQALALGHISNWEAGRKLIARSFPMEVVTPSSDWNPAADRFEKL